MSDRVMKDWFQKLSEVPGSWKAEAGLIRHTTLTDNGGSPACPIVAVTFNEKKRSVGNHEIVRSGGEAVLEELTGLPYKSRSIVVQAADASYQHYDVEIHELRKQLKEVCNVC